MTLSDVELVCPKKSAVRVNTIVFVTRTDRKVPDIPLPLKAPGKYAGFATAAVDLTAKQLNWVQAGSRIVAHSVQPTVQVISLPEVRKDAQGCRRTDPLLP